MNSAHENSVRCGPPTSSRCPSSSAVTLTAAGSGAAHSRIDKQRLGVRRDLLGLGKDRLDLVGVLVARDDLPRQGEHQVVAVVPVGVEAVLGEFALDGERALQLLRHELEGVGLDGVSGRP